MLCVFFLIRYFPDQDHAFAIAAGHLAIIAFVVVVVLPMMLFIYLFVRLRDYAVIYQSYDDNAVVDKVARLVDVVLTAVCVGLRNICLLWLYKCGLLKRPRG